MIKIPMNEEIRTSVLKTIQDRTTPENQTWIRLHKIISVQKETIHLNEEQGQAFCEVMKGCPDPVLLVAF